MTPEFRQRTEHDLLESLKNLEPWVLARTLGDPISRLRKDRIVTILRDEILFLLCGHDWVKIERKLEQSPNCLADFKFAISTRAHHGPFIRALYDTTRELASSTNAEICELLSTLVASYLDLPMFSFGEERLDQSRWITEFAFRLIYEPEGVRKWTESHFSDGFRYLAQNPILPRAARFAFLLRANAMKTLDDKTDVLT